MAMNDDFRKIVFRTNGWTEGPITRLVGPGDLGELIKPFVFLDYVNAKRGPGFDFHPHSGIATLTHPLTFDVKHETSSGQVDQVTRGGVEWVVTGGGLWHRGQTLGDEAVQGFQLWLALPPHYEHREASAQFITPEQVPTSGPVTVLLGSYENAKSLIQAPMDANCFVVRLKANSSWTYLPPASHQIAFAFAQQGRVEVSGNELTQELVVFEEGSGSMSFRALEDCTLLFGCAAKHPYPLVIGDYSVHTSSDALTYGQRKIDSIGMELFHQGRISNARMI